MSSSERAIPIIPAEKFDSVPPTSSIGRSSTTLVRRKSPWKESSPDELLSFFEEEEVEEAVDEDVEDTSDETTLSRNSVAMRIVDTLVERGVTTFFGIPGGPICPLFEALRVHPVARLIESRHEANAAFAAAAYHRATGRAAAVVVTAGPGITNVITGVASAHAENVPLVLIAGDVAWGSHGGRLAQDSGPEGLNIDLMLAPVTRAQIRITNGRSAVGQTLAALNAACEPMRPGPALLVVPIDRAKELSPPVSVPAPRVQSIITAPPEAVRTTARWLMEAKRPLLVLGAGCMRQHAWIRQLVDALDVPFVTTPRAKGVVSEDHPRSLRNGGMAASMWARRYTAEGVDVALVLGTDLDDSSVGPTPYVGPGGKLIHVDLDARVFNRNLPTALAITADVGHFCNDLYRLIVGEGLLSDTGSRHLRSIRAESPYSVANFDTDRSATIAPHRAIADLQKALPGAAIVTDIGEHMLFALHYIKARGPDDFHIQLNLGSMGSGIAGAIGLAAANPERPVICVCGDGGMQMAGMEILTAVNERLPIVYAVFNDSRYNMVHHGMKQIFGRASAYETTAVDFAAWAESMNVPAKRVRRPRQINELSLRSLMQNGGPVLLDIRIDRDIRLQGGGRVEALQHMSMLHVAHERNGA